MATLFDELLPLLIKKMTFILMVPIAFLLPWKQKTKPLPQHNVYLGFHFEVNIFIKLNTGLFNSAGFFSITQYLCVVVIPLLAFLKDLTIGILYADYI